MLDQRKPTVVVLFALLFLVACAAPQPKAEEEQSPLRLLIGDGGVRIEESYSHVEGEKARVTAAFTSEHNRFTSSEKTLEGSSWVEESSEFSLEPGFQAVECQVKISRQELERAPAAAQELYTYEIDVTVKDGIKDGPFETVINGESEGLVQLGEYPVNNWQSTENLIVNDTVVESWFYEPKKNRYEIVKKMGEDRYLKKSLRFDPYLKSVTSVQYEILQGQGEEVDQQRTVLARLHCRS